MICGFRLQSFEILLDAPHNSHDPTILKFKSHQVETGIFRSHLVWGCLGSVKDFTTVGLLSIQSFSPGAGRKESVTWSNCFVH